MMSAKMAAQGFLKITVFWNKGYDIIIPVDEVTSKILSRGLNYVVDKILVTLTFLWEKLSEPHFYKDLTKKHAFFESWSMVQVQ